jgi:phosphoglycerol transferase MdoB-like AlkP superfamily enzyme
VVCYSSIIPLFLFLFQLNIKRNFLKTSIIWYASILFSIYFSLSTAELELYKEWGIKLNFKALNYLKNPSEVFKTTPLYFIILFFVLLILQVFFCIQFLKKLLPTQLPNLSSSNLKKIFTTLIALIIGSSIIAPGVRGGFNQIPINQSVCYYSKHNILNLAATNTVFNVIHSVLQNKKVSTHNIYKVLNNQEALTIVKSLNTPAKDTTVYFLTNQRPNVFIILFEGWAGDAIGACNGDSLITPYFNSLANKGINFERCYASGNRSDQGVAAIFSAFPAQSLTSIIEQPDKFSKLPSIIRSFSEAGYETRFYFGGQLSYANIESYMVYNKVDKIVDEKILKNLFPSGRLVVHDEYVYKYITQDIKSAKKPFFITFFTGSTHAPYDIPQKRKKHSKNEMEDYINSLTYADSCLKIFMEQNKDQEWFKNTLFVFVSDHCHMTHRYYDYYDMLNHHIPLLFYGNVIKPEFRGVNFKHVVSQTDLAATLLKQLQLSSKPFVWSKNLMNPTYRHFAFYSFPSGGGWVNDTNAFSYNYSSDKFEWSNIQDSLSLKKNLNEFKAYMQVMFQNYLDY